MTTHDTLQTELQQLRDDGYLTQMQCDIITYFAIHPQGVHAAQVAFEFWRGNTETARSRLWRLKKQLADTTTGIVLVFCRDTRRYQVRLNLTKNYSSPYRYPKEVVDADYRHLGFSQGIFLRPLQRAAGVRVQPLDLGLEYWQHEVTDLMASVRVMVLASNKQLEAAGSTLRVRGLLYRGYRFELESSNAS